MSILIWAFVMFVSLFLLVRSAGFFVNYSEQLGLLFGMSPFIIGTTIVAVGTSLPELVSSFFALQAGETEFVVDNVVGSNIANAFLILGLAAVAAGTLKLKSKLIDIDLPFFFMSAALFFYFTLDSQISNAEGFMLLVFFIIFLAYNIQQKNVDEDNIKPKKKQFREILKCIAILIVSITVLSLSAKYLVDSILSLSALFGIASSILTITVVALGTSLPEILASIAAVRRGSHSMAVGNVLGSNTLNVLLVVGLPSVFVPLTIAPATFAVGIVFLVIATMTVIFVTIDDKVRLWEGVAMLMLYSVFISKIVGIV